MAESMDQRNRLSHTTHEDTNNSQATRSAWLWGSVVVAFLILQLVIGVLAFKLATGDPSVAVMPDYHERALHWDDELARRKRSDQLGWKSAFQWGDLRPQATGREFAVDMVDSAGNAVTGGEASVRFFHHARGVDVATMKLQERLPGEYVAQLPMAKLGLWDVEFSLSRGQDEAYWRQETIDIVSDTAVGVASGSDDTETDAAE
jgi:nitrogen fixation protein FixH